jgi:hypothetical protein
MQTNYELLCNLPSTYTVTVTCQHLLTLQLFTVMLNLGPYFSTYRRTEHLHWSLVSVYIGLFSLLGGVNLGGRAGSDTKIYQCRRFFGRRFSIVLKCAIPAFRAKNLTGNSTFRHIAVLFHRRRGVRSLVKHLNSSVLRRGNRCQNVLFLSFILYTLYTVARRGCFESTTAGLQQHAACQTYSN